MNIRNSSILLTIILSLILSTPAHTQVSSADTDFLYARKLYDDKLYALAAQEFGKFIRNYPSDMRIPDARYYSGMAQFNEKNYEQARRDFQFLAIDYPKDKRAPDAWAKIAECYAAMGDYPSAANALTSIATFYPTAPNAVTSIIEASEYFIKAGDLRSAKDRLQKLIADRPDIPEANVSRFKLAMLLKNENDWSAASGALQTVIEKSKDQELVASAMFEQAGIADRLGKSDEARNAYVRIVTRYSKTKVNVYALFELGNILFRERNFIDARKNFEIVISNTLAPEPLKHAAQINLGDILFVNEKYTLALDLYKRVSSEKNDSLNALEANFKSGLASEKLNLPVAAGDYYYTITEQYAAAFQTSEFVKWSTLKLAQISFQLKRYKEAGRYYEDYITKYPKSGDLDRVLYDRGLLLKDRLADYAEASRMFTRLISEFPNSEKIDDAYLALAQSLRMDNQISEALDALEKLKSNYPGTLLWNDALNERRRIEYFHQYGNNTTTQSIIYLIGNLIEDKPKDEITFAYARLFFEQLKDYEGAAGLFKKTILSTKNRALTEEALFYLAQTYDRISEMKPTQAGYADSAVGVYKQLAVGKYADVATLRVIESTLKTINNSTDRQRKAKEMYTGLLERFPGSTLKPNMLKGLGDAMMALGELKPVIVPQVPSVTKSKDKSSVTAKPDSLKPLSSAMQCYEAIIKDFPDSPVAEDAFYSMAEAYWFSKQPDLYYQTLIRYAAQYPRGRYIVKTKMLMARYKEEKSDYALALNNLNEIITHYFYTPYADSAAQSVGHNYLLSGQYTQAIKAYLNARTQGESALEQMDIIAAQQKIHHPLDYRLAYCYDKSGNFTKAVEYYEAYLFPDNKGEYALHALTALAQMYEKKQDFQIALPYYQRIAQLYPETEAGFKALARASEMYFNSEQYDSAKVAFTKLALYTKDKMQQIVFESRTIVCAYRLGQIVETGKLEKDFNKKYESDKNLKLLLLNYNAEFLFELGRYYQYNKTRADYAQAVKTYTRVIEDYKTAAIMPEVLFEMGVIKFNEGKSKEGFEYFQQIPQKWPDSDILPRVHLRTAFEAFRLENVQLAVEASKLALQNPRIKLADAKLGTNFLIKVYKAAGYYENGLMLMQQYLERFPDDDPATIWAMRIDIGAMHKNLKSFDRALEYFKDLIKTASGEDEAEIQFNIAETYWAMNNFEQALLEYLRIPYLTLGKKFDWSSAAKSQAAECYVKLSKYDEAIRMYNDIIRVNGPQSEYSAYAKQRIEQIQGLKKN